MKKIVLLLIVMGVFALGTTSVFAGSVRLNHKKMTVRVATKAKLKVKRNYNHIGKVRWKSSNKKVATVTKHGNVKGKKPGTARISARFKIRVNGRKRVRVLRCRVKVKKNSLTRSYLESMYSAFSSGPGYIDMKVIGVEYKSNGRVLVKVRFTNNTSYYREITYYSVKAYGRYLGGTLFKQKFIFNEDDYWEFDPYESYTISFLLKKKNVKKIVNLRKYVNKHGFGIDSGCASRIVDDEEE